MKRMVLFCMFLSFFGPDVSAQDYYFRFLLKRPYDIEKITRIISIDKVLQDTVYAYATKKQWQRFQSSTDYKAEMLSCPAYRTKGLIMASTTGEMMAWDRYPTHQIYLKMMRQFAAVHPEICMLDTIGYSVEGKPLLSVKISDHAEREEDEPDCFYTSTMHGDETAGFILMLRFIDTLLTGYGKDTSITRLIDRLEIYINPLANPDGTYAGGEHTVAGATRYNANEIDLNRNFPDPENGLHPDGNTWQSETRAMMNYAEDQQFVLSANFHSGAEVVNYPWDTWSRAHVDASWFRQASFSYAQPAIVNSPDGYFEGISTLGIIKGYNWYPIYGGRMDYMTYFHGGREVTVELSDIKLPDGELLKQLWNYNRASLIAFLEQALYGIHGKVTDPEGNPVTARITVLNHDKTADSSYVFSDPHDGYYHRMIDSGIYDLAFTSFGYVSDTVSNVRVNPDDSQCVDVILRPVRTHTFSGKIIDAGSGKPVKTAALIFMEGSYDTSHTNNAGEFSIPEVHDGIHNLRIFKQGYKLRTTKIQMDSTKEHFSFQLNKGHIEDFEPANPGGFVWDSLNDQSWQTSLDASFVGEGSARTGKIDDNGVSALCIQVDVAEKGNVCFFRKISSEANYDFMKFYLDGVLQERWSGMSGWQRECFQVSSGDHVFQWIYEKDGGISKGEDAAWIDYIEFPKLEQPELTWDPEILNTTVNMNTSDTLSLQLQNNGNIPVELAVEIGDSSHLTWIKPVSGIIRLAAGAQKNVLFVVETDNTHHLYTGHILLSGILTEKELMIPVEVRTNQDTAVSVRSQEALVDCYPNPFDRTLHLHIKTHSHQQIKVKVFDLQGRMLYSAVKPFKHEGLNELQLHIDHESSDNRILLLQVITEDGIIHQKLLLQSAGSTIDKGYDF